MALTINLATAIVSNTSTPSTSGSFTPSVGEYLIAIATGGATSSVSNTPAITDSQAGTWTTPQTANLSTLPGGGGGGSSCAIAYRQVSTSSSMTVTSTVTGGTPNDSSIQVYRVSSANGVLIGTSNKGAPTNGTLNITPTAFTSTIPNSTMFVGFSEWSGSSTITTSDLTLTYHSDANQEGGGGYKALGSVGSQTFNLVSSASPGGHWFWVALEVGEITPISATETGHGSDSSSSIVAAISNTETSSGSDVIGLSQGKGAVDSSTSTDLGSVAAIPVFGTETSSSADAVSALSVSIVAFEPVMASDNATLVVPPTQIQDYDFVHSLDFFRRVGKGPYRLDLPYTDGWRADHPFFRRIPVHRGLSLLRIGGLFQLIQDPTFEQFAAADRIYLGGYDNWVTDDEAQELGNAGWASYIEGFTFIPDAYYGSGQYGISVYGN